MFVNEDMEIHSPDFFRYVLYELLFFWVPSVCAEGRLTHMYMYVGYGFTYALSIVKMDLKHMHMLKFIFKNLLYRL